jgi:hypothetical protein
MIDLYKGYGHGVMVRYSGLWKMQHLWYQHPDAPGSTQCMLPTSSDLYVHHVADPAHVWNTILGSCTRRRQFRIAQLTIKTHQPRVFTHSITMKIPVKSHQITIENHDIPWHSFQNPWDSYKIPMEILKLVIRDPSFSASSRRQAPGRSWWRHRHNAFNQENSHSS